MKPETKLTLAAQRMNTAQQEMRDAVLVARASGMPLRTIARYVGLSHEQVRRIASG